MAVPLLFAEGYATAASLHEATGLPVLMTVDASNMIAVAENARQIWTDSPFVFCADNDHQRKLTKGFLVQQRPQKSRMAKSLFRPLRRRKSTGTDRFQ